MNKLLSIKSMNKRILYLDFLKIISAFLVVFYHFSFYKLNYGYQQGSIYIPNLNRIIMSIAACSVPIFFIVNGTLLFKKHRTNKEIYLKALKIFALYMIWSVVEFPSCFFRTLIILYIIFPILQYFYENYIKVYNFICISIFIMPFIYNAIILITKCYDSNYIYSLIGIDLPHTGLFTMYSILYFLIGPILHKKDCSIWLGWFLSLLGMVYLIAECTIYTTLNKVIYDGVNSSFPTLGALFLSIGVFIICKKINFDIINKVILFLSDMILPIYLMHMLAIKILNFLFDINNINLFEGIFISLIVFFFCGIVGKIMSEVPILKWIIKM